MTDEVKAAEAAAAPDEAALSHDERAAALIEAYSHALSTNSPRTVAELNELKALLGA